MNGYNIFNHTQWSFLNATPTFDGAGNITNLAGTAGGGRYGFGALNTVEDLLRHPQLAARDRWYEVDTPSGPALAIDHPLNLAGLPRRSEPVPGLGDSTEQIRQALGTGKQYDPNQPDGEGPHGR